MDESTLAEHIESIAARSAADARHLMARMLGRSWPGGGDDRVEPVAVQWVRRWRPTSAGLTPPACSCAHGRCGVCN